MCSRLEKSEGELKNCLEGEKKKGAESEAALKEQKGRLEDTTAELVSTQTEARSLKEEAESLLQRMGALEEAVARLQGEVERARAQLRDREAEERRLCLSLEQLETDLRSSKAFAESLQAELHQKEQREVEMLGEKERAVAEVPARSIRRPDSAGQRVHSFNRISRVFVHLRLRRRPGERPSAGREEPRRSWSRGGGSCARWRRS